MTPDEAISELQTRAEDGRAAQMAAYHKAPRRYLGVPNPATNEIAGRLRKSLSVDERTALAEGLWKTDIFEARLLAAKMLTQARIRPDEAVWTLISGWVPDFDSWAIADHACMAGMRRLTARPARVDEVESWTRSPHMWTRRAALVITLPWTKQNHPTAEDIAIRERVLGWAAGYVEDREWFIQKAVAWWVRELSKHDVSRAAGFLETHGAALKAFARREAGKYL